MKSNTVLSSLSSAALLDLLGLQAKQTASRRALTYAGFAAAGLVVGAVAAAMITPKSGRQLRTDLRVGAKEMADQMGATATHALDGVKRRASEIKNHSSEPTGV